MNPLNPEVSMQQLQARVAQLEQENAALRSLARNSWDCQQLSWGSAA